MIVRRPATITVGESTVVPDDRERAHFRRVVASSLVTGLVGALVPTHSVFAGAAAPTSSLERGAARR